VQAVFGLPNRALEELEELPHVDCKSFSSTKSKVRLAFGISPLQYQFLGSVRPPHTPACQCLAVPAHELALLVLLNVARLPCVHLTATMAV
jgi:hypothetical protein